MTRSAAFLLLVVTILLMDGCSSSGVTERDRLLTAPPDTATQTHRTNFETRTDTVAVQRIKEQSEPTGAYNSAPIRFMVQIGSYKNAKNASEAQARARQRYKLPVVNDYNAARHRYQIRIGFFETDKAAGEFSSKLMHDYPQEYKDAWVVQIMKR